MSKIYEKTLNQDKQLASKHMKKCYVIIHQGNAHVNKDTTIHLLEHLKILKLTYQIVIKVWSNCCLYTTHGNAEWYHHFGKQFGDFFKS